MPCNFEPLGHAHHAALHHFPAQRGGEVHFREMAVLGIVLAGTEAMKVMSDSQLTTIGRLEDRLDSLKVRL